MRVEIKHYGFVKDGKKVYHVPELYRQQLQELEGKEFVEIIKERHKPVTLNQHAYYRGVILPICHKTNRFIHFFKKDDIHEDHFAPMFLGYVKVVEIDGKTKEQQKVRSLEDLSKAEMSEFIERVIQDCAENDIEIPPSEMAYSKYYNK